MILQAISPRLATKIFRSNLLINCDRYIKIQKVDNSVTVKSYAIFYSPFIDLIEEKGFHWSLLILIHNNFIYNYMYGSRGQTIQQNGYLDNGKPQEVEMKRYTEEPNTAGKYYENKPEQYRGQESVKEEESLTGYFLHWLAFLIAMGVNIGIWAIDYNVIGRQASTYYYNTYYVSPYVVNGVSASSTSLFTTSDPHDTLGIAIALIYGWVLWKGPLLVFTLHLTDQQQSKGLRFGSWAAEVVILLAIDILLTIFTLSFYADWIFFGIYTLLTVIVVVINNNSLNRTKESLANSLIPLLLIAFLYCVYSLFLPTLYKVYLDKLSTYSARFLVIYLYPLFDLLIYAITLFLGTKVEDNVKGFFSVIHYFLIGYGVGYVLLCGYTEVEFYYLIGYFIFRNVFVNHVMRKWERVVANPPALPGWGVAYYVGYALSFMPVIGVGKLVVAKSFMSYIYARSDTILYSAYNPLYPSSTPPSSGSISTNFSFGGNIYWLSGILIWLATTFSQRYDRKSPKAYDFFYYFVGIQLFYIGIACSLSCYVLAQYASL